MQGTKRARESKGVIGAMAVLIAVGLQQLGVDLDAGEVTEWLLAGVAFVGGITSLIGRLKAIKEIEGV